MKIYLAQINTTAGDLEGNKKKILSHFQKASDENCDLVIFPEMALTGYPCEDLWNRKYFLSQVEKKIEEICEETKHSNCALLFGATSIRENRSKKKVVYNSAFLIERGEVEKIINKKSIANYSVFDEKRHFEAENFLSLVEFRGATLAILICEDFWDEKNLFLLKEQIFDAVIVVNSSPYTSGKHLVRIENAKKFARTLSKPVIYVNQIGGQDSLVFDGASFVVNDREEVALQMKEFEEDFAIIEIQKNDQKTKVKTENISHKILEPVAQNYAASVLGLRDYVLKNGFKKILIGMSGGIDSAITAVIACDAIGSENVSLYALPSRYNSETSMIDAKKCAQNLSINLEIISIEDAFESMLFTLKDRLESKAGDITKENLQSRIRANILMALSNNSGALLITTGNKSEIAMGYATLYGDMCGAFNPIKDLYKTQIYEIAKWRNESVLSDSFCAAQNPIPQNILTKEPTAELRENQKDSDSLPVYEILDEILFNLIEKQKSVLDVVNLGFDQYLVEGIAKTLAQNEFKRRQSAIGVKISQMSFDKDWRYPITNKFFK